MFTIIWSYERPNKNSEFYYKTPRGSEFQKVIDELKVSSGLVISNVQTVTPNLLNMVSTYKYESKENCEKFTQLLLKEIPTYFTERNLYIIEESHRLTGVASEPIFRPYLADFSNWQGPLSTIMTIPTPSTDPNFVVDVTA